MPSWLNIPGMYGWDEHPRYFRVREGGDTDETRAERRPVLAPSPAQLRWLGLAPYGPRVQATGARAQRSGRAFEADIEAANALYERHGRAVVYRHFPYSTEAVDRGSAVGSWARTRYTASRAGPRGPGAVPRMAAPDVPTGRLYGRRADIARKCFS